MAGLVLAVAVVLWGSPVEVQGEARRVLEGGFQRELPLGEAGAGEAAKAGRSGAPAAPRRARRAPRERRRGGPLSSVAQLLLWATIAVGLGLGAFWLARELSGYAGDEPARGADGEAEARAGPDRAVIDRPLGDADELARQGRFGEAVHVLLLRTLQELAGRLPERLPSSLTSREILERVRMPGEARDALSVLVSAAEVCHFGGRDPDAADFAACRGHFERFAAAYLRGGA